MNFAVGLCHLVIFANPVRIHIVFLKKTLNLKGTNKGVAVFAKEPFRFGHQALSDVHRLSPGVFVQAHKRIIATISVTYRCCI